jgi:hypothetical protein
MVQVAARADLIGDKAQLDVMTVWLSHLANEVHR